MEKYLVTAMNHFVPLNRLPEDLEFPAELKQRIWYDDATMRLAYDGFMSKATFDALYHLNADSAYRRALEELFRVATPEDTQPQKRGVFVVAGFFIVAAVVSLVGTVLLFQ